MPVAVSAPARAFVGVARHLWVWINVSSVLWMMLCGVVLLGVSVFGMYWIGPAVLIVPFLLGALNACGVDPERWAAMAMSAVPFVLVSSVHMVLVLLFAVATIDRSAVMGYSGK